MFGSQMKRLSHVAIDPLAAMSRTLNAQSDDFRETSVDNNLESKISEIMINLLGENRIYRRGSPQ